MGNKLKHGVDRDFTVAPNIIFKDKRLSYKAKGLWLQIISLPEDWEFSVAGLAQLSTEKESAIRSGLKELEQHGYLIWRKYRENNQKYAVEVTSSLPIFSHEKISHEKISYEKICNNKELNNKELTNKELKDNIADLENPLDSDFIHIGVAMAEAVSDIESKTFTRRQDPIWDALIDGLKIDSSQLTKSGRGALNHAVKELKDVGATPEQIYQKIEIARVMWPDLKPTANQIASRWAELTLDGADLIVGKKARDRHLDQYRSDQNNLRREQEEFQRLLAEGKIDEQGNFIKRKELDS